jgi:hypothetical protein
MARISMIALVGSVFILTGCSLTLPVQGDFNKGKEMFLGQATGNMDGSGTIVINSESGVNCSGKFQYDEPRVSGSGSFECQDGRIGTFRFTSNGTSGMGFGKTNKGEPFKFTFGHTRQVTMW